LLHGCALDALGLTCFAGKVKNGDNDSRGADGLAGEKNLF
jgi:hypothetical protein